MWGLDEGWVVASAVECAEDAVDTIARVAEDALNPPSAQPLDKKIANGRDLLRLSHYALPFLVCFCARPSNIHANWLALFALLKRVWCAQCREGIRETSFVFTASLFEGTSYETEDILKSFVRLCSLVFAVLLVACGVNTAQQSGAAQPEAVQPANTPTAPVAEPAQPEEVDPLELTPVFVTIEPAEPYDGPKIVQLPMQSDAPPVDIPPELPETFGGTMFTCQALPDDSLGLQITIYEPVYELGQGFNFCLSGYREDLPIAGTVLFPDGLSAPFFLFPDATGGLQDMPWIPDVYAPLGEYTVTVTQGEATAEAHFSLQAATKPQFVIEPYFGAGNAYVPVLFAGFAPNSVQEPFLYRYDNEVWRYFASLPAIQFDAEGLLSLNLYIPEGYPSGRYQIVVPGLSDDVYPVTFVVE